VIRLSETRHRDIAFWGMTLIALGLPLSTILMSVGQFVLMGNWLLEGDLKRRLRQFFTDRLSLVLFSVFFMHLVAMAWASDLRSAWGDVQVKLPLFILPLVLFTSKLPEPKRLRQILYLFVLGTVAGSLVGLVNYLGLSHDVMVEKRHLSYFTSHIRFGMMAVFSIFILAHFLFSEWGKWPWAERIFTLIVIGWLFYFVVFLESATAYVIFAALFALALARMVFRSRSMTAKLVAAVVLIVGSISGVVYVHDIYENQMLELKFDYRTLDVFTKNGRYYAHETGIPYTENGHRVWNFVCWKELENEWPKKSTRPLYSTDLRGQELHYTLVRYMTSLGLHKDSIGVHQLAAKDVENVEMGFTNHRYAQRWGVSRRIAQFFWEMKEYAYNNNPNNSSLLQRWTYTKVGLDIVRENWLFGVGTAGLRSAYAEMYRKDDRNLFPQFQLIAHNQFLAVAICLGVFGGAWFIIAFLYPLWNHWRNFLYLCMFVMTAISFLSDNTLGTQSGTTLYAFMNALIIVYASYPKETDQ
jgi:O-antigen ligase